VITKNEGKYLSISFFDIRQCMIIDKCDNNIIFDFKITPTGNSFFFLNWDPVHL